MLYRNKHYQWEIMSQSISEGKWSQKGNIVTLMDTDIDFPFHAIMDSNGPSEYVVAGGLSRNSANKKN